MLYLTKVSFYVTLSSVFATIVCSLSICYFSASTNCTNSKATLEKYI